MKKILILLAASTALTAAVALPAWSALSAPSENGQRPFSAVIDAVHDAVKPVLVADRDRDVRRWSHDDDDHRDRRYDDGDDGDDDDDDDDCASARNPTPAGTGAPPQNGLFGNGTPPQVRVN